MGRSEYVLAFAAFFTSHALPLRPQFMAALAWLIGAASRAPHVVPQVRHADADLRVKSLVTLASSSH